MMAAHTARPRPWVSCPRRTWPAVAIALIASTLLGLSAGPAGAATVIATIPTPGAAADGIVAVNPRTNLVYIPDGGSAGGVQVIDGATNTLIKTIPVGRVPYGAAVNPTTNRVYVAKTSDGTVSVIDGATNAVSTTIDLGAGTKPAEVAVNPATNAVYVTDLKNYAVLVIDGATNRVQAQRCSRRPVDQHHLRDQPWGRQRVGDRRHN